MALQSHHLEAFLVISRVQNFSKAAEILHVTQSALSHRIAALENELGAPLFIRDKKGIRLTESGEELLRYVQMKNSLEEEFLSKFKAQKGSPLKGVLRVGCYASIGRSIVLKVLSPFLKQNPGVQLFFLMREMSALPELLKSGEADFVFLDHEFGKGKLISHFLGEEEYVLVEAVEGARDENVYLNHDEEDFMTYRFFEKQGEQEIHIRRSYLDEIYSCMDGVAEGMGRSVLPLHLVKEDSRIRIHEEFMSLKMPVYLHYFQHQIRSELDTNVIDLFRKEIPKHLVGHPKEE
jgi:DNA-binding transcriptional LysR family regulator